MNNLASMRNCPGGCNVTLVGCWGTNITYPMHHLIKLTHYNETKKRTHESQIANASFSKSVCIALRLLDLLIFLV